MTSFARGVGETITRNDNLSSLMTILRVLLLTSGFTNSGFTATGFSFGSIQIEDAPSKSETRKPLSSIVLSDTSGSIINILGYLRYASEVISKSGITQRLAKFIRDINKSGFVSTGFTTSGFTIAQSIQTQDKTNKGINRFTSQNFPATLQLVVSVKNILGNLRFVENTIPRNDSVNFVASRFRTILHSGGFTLSGFTITGFLVGNDGVNFSDKINMGVKYTLTSSTSLSDTPTTVKNILGNLRYISQNISISELVKKGVGKIIAESRGFTLSGFTISGFTSGGLIINDIVEKSKGQFSSVSSSVTFGDSISITIQRLSTVLETVVLSQIITKDISKIIQEVSGFTFTGFTQSGFVLNQYYIGDSVTTVKSVYKNLEEAIWDYNLFDPEFFGDGQVYILDVVSGVKNVLGNLRYTTESTTLSDSVSRMLASTRTALEQFGFTLSGFTRSGFTFDGVPIDDFITLTKQDLFVNIAETSGFTITGFTESGFFKGGGVFVGDQISRIVSELRTNTENITISDSLLTGLTFTLSESFSLSDVIIRTKQLVADIQNTKGFVDSGFTQSGFTFATGIYLNDQIGVLKHIGNLFRDIYEVSGFTITGFTDSGFFIGGGVFIGDQLQKNVNKVLTNTVSVVDALNRTRGEFVPIPTFQNTIILSDVVDKISSLVRLITDQSGFTQTGFTLTGFTKDESIYISDSPQGISRITTLFRSISETSGFTLTGFTDSGFYINGGVFVNDIIGKDISKFVSDSISLLDLSATSSSTQRFISEISISISDSISNVKGFVRFLTDGGFTRSGFTESGFFVDSSILINDTVTQSLRIANNFRTIVELGGFTFSGFTTSGFLIGGTQVFDYVNSFTSKLRTIEEQSIWDFNIFDPEIYGAWSVALLDTLEGVKNINGNVRFATETVTVTTQSIVKDVSKTLLELGGFTGTGFTESGFLIGGVAIVDILEGIKTTPRNMFETIIRSDIVDRRNWNFRHMFDTSLGVGYEILDNVKSTPAMIIYESISSLDIIDRTTELYKSISETNTINDILINGTAFNVIIDEIEIIFSDNIVKTFGVSISETVSIIDGVISQINVFGTLRPISDSISLSQSITKDVTKSILEGFVGFTKTGFTTTGFTMIGGVGIYDVVDRVRGYTSIINDTIILSDSVSRIINELGNLRYVVETITSNDSVDRVIDMFRELLQIAGFTQSGFTSSGFFLSGGVNIIDFVEDTKQDIIRAISESSGFTLTGFTQSGFYINGGVFVNDIIQSQKDFTRIVSESGIFDVELFDPELYGIDYSIIISDAISTSLTITISETESISDLISKQVGNIREILQQNGFTKTGFTLTGFTTFDGINVFDSVQKVTSNEFFRVIEESSGFSITGFTQSGFYINGGVFINDVVGRVGVFSRSVSSTTIVNDSLNRIESFLRSVSSITTLSDSISRIISHIRNISEAQGFTLSGFTLSGFVHGFQIDVSDVVIASKSIKNKFRTINEISGFTFSGFTNTGFYINGVTIIDTISKGITYSISESIARSDSLVGSKNLFGTLRGVVESVNPLDFVDRLISDIRDIFEVRGFTFSGFTRSGFVFSGGVYMLDIAERVKGDFVATTSSVSTISDSVLVRMDLFRVLIENVSATSIINRILISLRNVFETTGFTKTGFTLSGFYIGTTVDIFDSLTGTRSVLSNVPNQAIDMLDVLSTSTQDNVIVNISETIANSEIISRTLIAFRNVYEIRGFTLSGFTISGFVQNGVGIYDSITKLQSIHLLRNVFEGSGFTLTGFTTSGFTVFGGVLVDDYVNRLTTLNVSISDTISITGIAIRVISSIRSISTDIINLSDSVDKVIDWFRYISESSGFTLTGFTDTGFVKDAGIYVFDSVVQLKETGNLFRDIYDTSGFTITGFTSSGFYINGGVFIGDIISKSVNKILFNNVTSNDNVGKNLNPLFRSISDSAIVFSDSISRVVDMIRIISIKSGFTLSGFTATGFVVDAGISIGDVNQGFKIIGNFFRNIAESSGFTVTGFTPSGFTIGGGVFIGDAINQVYRAFVRYPQDTTLLDDTVSSVINLFGRLIVITETSIASVDSIRKDITKLITETTGFTVTGFTPSGFTIFSSGIITDYVERTKNFVRDVNENEIFDMDIFDPEIFGSSYHYIGDQVVVAINNLGNLRGVVEQTLASDSTIRLLSSVRNLLNVAGFTQTGFTDSGFFKLGGASIFDVVSSVRDQDYIRNIVESSGFTITGFTLSGFTLGGGVGIYDTVERLQTTFRSMSENITISESSFVTIFVGLIENIVTSQIITRSYNATRQLTGTFGFTFSGFTTSGFTLENVTSITDSIQANKLVGNFFRTIYETSGFTSSGFTLSGFTISGAISVFDFISKNVGKTVTNNISISEIISKDAGRGITSTTISFSDSINRYLQLNRIVNEFRPFTSTGFTLSGFIGGGVSVQDILIVNKRIGNFFRFITDTSGFTQSGFTSSGFTVGNDIQLNDVINSAIRGVPRNISENIAESHILERVLTSFRLFTENIVIPSDLVETSATDLLVAVNETALVLSDTIRKDVLKNIYETVIVIDLLDRTMVSFRSITGVVVVLSDSVDRTIALLRNVAESVVLSDSITKDVVKNISELITITDSITKDVTKNISETVVLSDSVLFVRGVIRVVFNTVVLTDVISKDVLKNIFETASILSDSVDRTIALLRNVVSNVSGIGDSIVRNTQLNRSVLYTVILSDSVDRTIAFLRNTSSIVSGISDLVDRSISSIRNTTSTVVLSDSVDRVIQSFRSVVSNVVLSDSVDRTIVFLRNVQVNIIVSIDDIFMRQGRILSEVILRSESLVRKITLFRNISLQTISISDSLIRNIDLFRTLLNNVTVSDNVERLIVLLRSIDVQNVTISDGVVRIISFLRNLSESISISDLLSKASTLFRNAINIINQLDVIQRVIVSFRSILAQTIVLTDNITIDLGFDLFESISISDVIIKDVVKNITNIVNINDFVAKGIGYSIVEPIVNVSDSAIRVLDFFRINLNTITITDTIIKDVTKNISEIIISTDIINSVRDVLRNTIETVSITDLITKDILKNIYESISITDDIIKDVTKSLTEIIVLSDNVSYGVGYFISETVIITDAITKDITKTIIESISITDSIEKDVLKNILETITITDSIVKDIVKNISENVVSSDDIQKDVSKFISQTVLITDSIVSGSFRLIEEADIVISDSIGKDVTKNISQTISVIDVLNKGLSYSIFQPFPTTVTDNVSYGVGYFITESVVITDNIIKDITKNISEIISLSDSISRGVGYTITESISISDNIIKDINKNILESISITDTVSYGVGYFISETIVISDNIVKDVTKNISETISVTDDVSYGVGYFITESVVLSDSVLKDITKTILESIVITDLIIKDVTKNISETISVTDDISYGVGYFMTETVNISDDVSMGVGFVLTETVNITDNIVKDVSKFIGETVIISDNVVMGVGIVLTETITLSDDIAKDVNKNISETIVITDNIIKDVSKFINEVAIILTDEVKGAYPRNISETIVLSDNVSYGVGYFISETITISDNIIKDVTKSMIESISITDTLSYGAGYNLLENIVLTDVISKDVLKNIYDSVLRNDLLNKGISKFIDESAIFPTDDIQKNVQKVLLENIVILDNIQKDVLKNIYETILIVDNLSRGVFRIIEETISIVDTIIQSINLQVFETIVIVDSIQKDVLKNVLEVISIVDELLGDFAISTALQTTTIIKTSLETTSLISQSLAESSLSFETLIKDNAEFNTIIKQSILFNTLVKQSILFNSILRQTITFGTIVKDSVEFATYVKQSIIFTALIKDSVIFTTQIKNMLEIIARIKIVLYFNSLIGNDGNE